MAYSAEHPMMSAKQRIEFAIEVFVRGHSAVKSRTHPYEVDRFGSVWVMRDAPRKQSRDYRKEEWIAFGLDPHLVDAIARAHARGRFFVCALLADGEPDAPLREAYKTLGYRLIATEGFFVHDLTRVPRRPSPASIERVQDADMAAALAKMTRTRPIPPGMLSDDASFRQYVALDAGEIVGRVRSVDAIHATWCADTYVMPAHRRRGIGQSLLARMLRDDRVRASKCSVLTASHIGGMLYPRVGYQRVGTLFMFAPRKPS
jgi:GNAT superfamily N-acetyltransferase